MATQEVKGKIHDLLKTYFKDQDDAVDVSDGYDDLIHVVVVSRKFDGMETKQKDDLVNSVLTGGLADAESQSISLLICASPEDLKAGFIF